MKLLKKPRVLLTRNTGCQHSMWSCLGCGTIITLKEHTDKENKKRLKEFHRLGKLIAEAELNE
jgi:hypothetical protein